MTSRRRSAKRTFGEISKLPSGRFRARFTGPDLNRHSAPTTFVARIDAEAWLVAQERAISRGEWSPPVRQMAEAPQQRPPTLSEYAATVIGRRRLRPATLALYEKLLRLAITPTFGDRQPSEISVAEVTAWYRSMNATPTQQANAYGLLKSILKDAVEDGLIATNPCRVKAGGQKTRAREIEVLSVEQLAAYLAAVPEARQVPLLLAGWCGLRSGEVRALRVRDLDLDAGVVRVRQGVVRLAGELLIGPPKTTAGVRDVTIPPHLVPSLREWQRRQPTRGRDALLFPAGDGVSPLNDSAARGPRQGQGSDRHARADHSRSAAHQRHPGRPARCDRGRAAGQDRALHPQHGDALPARRGRSRRPTGGPHVPARDRQRLDAAIAAACTATSGVQQEA